MSQDVYHQIADVLLNLEMQMRAQSLWAQAIPEPYRLQSQEPFCVDTLNFAEWLQFIFLPRMSEIVEAGSSLPGASNISAMAEEYFKGLDIDGAEICSILEGFDLVIALYSDSATGTE